MLPAAGPGRLDVTDALPHLHQGALGFLLIGSPRGAEDTADNGRRTVLAGRAAADPTLRPRLLVYR
ncbi:hypothetical protein [Streptomyces sp. R41]|uniref:Uncharacterized protein n=1 Tax=Streptomyces sp. R41 TaxID=3238632 RepID=A0AB39RBA8_9ACTN